MPIIDRVFGMAGGLVLDFSIRTFVGFFHDEFDVDNPLRVAQGGSRAMQTEGRTAGNPTALQRWRRVAKRSRSQNSRSGVVTDWSASGKDRLRLAAENQASGASVAGADTPRNQQVRHGIGLPAAATSAANGAPKVNGSVAYVFIPSGRGVGLMRSSTGRWVCGDDFFDREAALRAWRADAVCDGVDYHLRENLLLPVRSGARPDIRKLPPQCPVRCCRFGTPYAEWRKARVTGRRDQATAGLLDRRRSR